MGDLLALWWVWIVAGAALGVLEVLVPGLFIFLGFALGAVVTGVLVGLTPLAGQGALTVLVFALASLAAWVALRAGLGGSRGQVKLWDRDINDG
jgi:membrane protein implicated in regulation of membrane protease activity